MVITLFRPEQLAPVAAALERSSGRAPELDAEARTITVEAGGAGAAVLADCVRALDATGTEAEDVVLRRPTLDEVFLSLTDREVAR